MNIKDILMNFQMAYYLQTTIGVTCSVKKTGSTHIVGERNRRYCQSTAPARKKGAEENFNGAANLQKPDDILTEKPSKAPKGRKKKKKFPSRSAGQTLGVVPREKDIVLVLSQYDSQGKYTLSGYDIIALDEGVTPGTQAYASRLGLAVHAFAGEKFNGDIWCLIPSFDIITKLLTIPRVSLSKMYPAVYWSFRNETQFDEKKFIFDFDITGRLKDGKTEVLAYIAPIQKINEAETLFKDAGIPLKGVSITPFGIQNLLRTDFVQPDCETVCTLFIGHDWSRIDVYTDKSLYLSRDIKTGYQSFLNCIMDLLPEKDYTGTDREMLAEEFFTHKLVHSMITDHEKNKHFPKIDPAADRLVKQIQRTFEFFIANSGKNPVRKIYLTGRLCDFTGLMDYIGKKLGISVETIDPFSGSIYQDKPIFELKSVADVYLPAFGAACSSNLHTPNFIYSFKDRLQDRRTKILDRFFLVAASVVILVLAGLSIWQGLQIKEKSEQIKTVQAQIDQMGPIITKEIIKRTNEQITQHKMRVKNTADHFFSVAAISEICRLTPSHIFIVNMVIKNQKTEEGPIRSVTVKGYIFEDNLMLASALAGYRESLSSSTLFTRIEVIKESFETLNNKEIVFFELKMDAGQSQLIQGELNG